jgi:hypothetical protein
VAHPGLGKTILSATCSFETCLWHPDPHHRKPAARAVEGATCNLPRYRRLGQNGGGQRNPDGRLVVEMMQILVRKDGIDDLIGCYRPWSSIMPARVRIVRSSASAKGRSAKARELCATAAIVTTSAVSKIFKLIQRGDRDVARPSEDPRRSRALTMLAQVRSEGLSTEGESSTSSQQPRSAVAIILSAKWSSQCRHVPAFPRAR